MKKDLNLAKIRWGFLGAGSIATRFGTGFQEVEDGELLAIGSRTARRRQELAEKFNVPRQYDSYEELVADPDIDVIYVATPHSLHHEHSIMALEAGKAVLCEKPFTINLREAAEIVALARNRNQFLMEAMWTRYIPIVREVKRMVQRGDIGDLTMLIADFGGRSSQPLSGRIKDPLLGGGALLDLGVYPVSLASYFFETPPTRIETLAHLQDGIDIRGGILFGYGDGRMAISYSSVSDNTPQEAILTGSKGQIRIPRPFWLNNKCVVSIDGQETRTIKADLITNGFAHEAMEVNRCMRLGLKESPDMTLNETLDIMGTLDTIRSQWGLRYPMENGKSVQEERA